MANDICRDCRRPEEDCLCHPLPRKETTVPDPTNPATPARRGLDNELQALAKIDRILADHDPQVAMRILDYLSRKTLARMSEEEQVEF